MGIREGLLILCEGTMRVRRHTFPELGQESCLRDGWVRSSGLCLLAVSGSPVAARVATNACAVSATLSRCSGKFQGVIVAGRPPKKCCRRFI